MFPLYFILIFKPFKWYLSPLQPATFIDNQMVTYLSLSFETQEGIVKCDD